RRARRCAGGSFRGPRTMLALGHLTKNGLTASEAGRRPLGQMTKNLARRTFDEDVVLDAAAHVFRKRGYGGATVREVAQAAGMFPGSPHHRYPSKDALLLDLMERAINRFSAVVREAVDVPA